MCTAPSVHKPPLPRPPSLTPIMSGREPACFFSAAVRMRITVKSDPGAATCTHEPPKLLPATDALGPVGLTARLAGTVHSWSLASA